MKTTAIQWCDSTVNFWTGCKKVSCGCFKCYLYRLKMQNFQNPTIVHRTNFQTFTAALYWDEPKTIFTCSMSDFFIKEADQWREDAWNIIRQTPQHKWLILTKRPERIKDCLPPDWGEGWDHVWLGVSVENEKYMHRADTLASIPAKTRFISAEPLLDQIDFSKFKDLMQHFHWVIIGGESGNEVGKFQYRECKQEWLEKIVNDLKPTDVAVFVKQTGSYLAKQLGLTDNHGGNMAEWPTHLQVREFPIPTNSLTPSLVKTHEGL